MSGLTRQLAEFVSGIEFPQLPPQAVETVKRGAIDCVGVLFAGLDEPVARVVRDLVAANPGAGEATVLFGAARAVSQDAALVNATAAHALDYDDTGINGHPSVILVPAMLAEGERLGASGSAMIAAWVAGYETWAELASRDEDSLHAKGWHPTSTFGTVAAAATAARVARLDADRTTCALGIAASMAAGLVANFGTMTKPFQAGRAVHNGILAARLAAAGMTAAGDAFEHKAGFLRAFSPAGRVRTDGPVAAGREWRILRFGLNVKRYPVCYAQHRLIDAMLDLVREHALTPARVESVEVRIGPLQAGMLRHSRPQNALDAKFSAEFGIASSLAARNVGLAQVSDDFVRSAAVQALLPKVRVATVESVDADEPLFALEDVVSATLVDGRTLTSAPVRHAKGHARRPVSLEELRQKFADCTAGVLSGARRDELFERLARLETLRDAAALYAAPSRDDSRRPGERADSAARR